MDVPADGVTMGEIVMRGNTVMKEYFRDPEATAEAFRGGWFHSGDLGVRYPDGYIQLMDRAKDIVISGGENISTVEVEHALPSHPAVADVAVIAVPDERWGERPKAFVVLAAGQHRRPGRTDQPRQGAHREVQGTQVGRLRPRTAPDLDRQDPQGPAAQGRMGRTRKQDPGMTTTDAITPTLRPTIDESRTGTSSSRTGDDLALSRGTDFYSLDELLTEHEREIRDRVRVWCDTEVAPVAAGYWETRGIPGRTGRRATGGSASPARPSSAMAAPGCRSLAEGMIAAELARGDGSIATLNAVHSGLAMTTIAMLGSAEQRARYLPRMATCEVLGAFALTEPNHGSDVVALETRAQRDGDEWVLDGAEALDRQRHRRRHRDRLGARRRRQVGAFVVEHPDGAEHPVPGYHARKIVGKAANRGVWQAQIRLDGVRVPADARLAKARTWDDTNYVLAKSRQTVAWEALGHAIAAYEAALTYSLRREQFGRPLARFQLIQDKLSHMLSDITGMQLMCTRMSQLQAQGRVSIEHAALAKLNTGDAARRVCAMARDILGGNGILLDHHVARHHADIEAVYTYEGTDSIQSLIVGRAITGINAFR